MNTVLTKPLRTLEDTYALHDECVAQWCVAERAGAGRDRVDLYQYQRTFLNDFLLHTLGSWNESLFTLTRDPYGFGFGVITPVLSNDKKSLFLFTGGQDGGAKLWQIDVNKPTELRHLTTLPGSYALRPAEERQEHPQWGPWVPVNHADFSPNGEWLFVEWGNGKIALFHHDSTGTWSEQPEKIQTPQCNLSCFVLDDGTVRSLYNNDLQLPDSAVSKAKPLKK